MSSLRKFPFVKRIFASDANFVLFEVRRNATKRLVKAGSTDFRTFAGRQVPHAKRVYTEMAARGVVIRFRGNQLNLTDCLRATIGSHEENDRMLELLGELCGGAASLG